MAEGDTSAMQVRAQALPGMPQQSLPFPWYRCAQPWQAAGTAPYALVRVALRAENCSSNTAETLHPLDFLPSSVPLNTPMKGLRLFAEMHHPPQGRGAAEYGADYSVLRTVQVTYYPDAWRFLLAECMMSQGRISSSFGFFRFSFLFFFSFLQPDPIVRRIFSMRWVFSVPPWCLLVVFAVRGSSWVGGA